MYRILENIKKKENVEMKQYKDLLKVVKEGPISYDLERKDEFKKKSMSFLRRLAKDLNVVEKDIDFNPAGVAVSGDATLMGMWGEDNGIYVTISDDMLMYRSIKHMKDYKGGSNNFIWSSWNKNYNLKYEEVLERMLRIQE